MRVAAEGNVRYAAVLGEPVTDAAMMRPTTQFITMIGTSLKYFLSIAAVIPLDCDFLQVLLLVRSERVLNRSLPIMECVITKLNLEPPIQNGIKVD